MPESEPRAFDERLRIVIESAPSGLLMVGANGRILLVNREVERLFGYARQELLGQPIELLVPERSRPQHPGFRSGFFSDPKVRPMGAGRDLFGVRKDGSELPVEIGLNPIQTEEGLFVLASVVDITARKAEEEKRRQLEQQLLQAQKMEAIGTLAGGVAHDFNNVLAAIVGYGELLKARFGAQPDALDDIESILQAAVRGRSLVERILRFSQRQSTVRKPLDLVPVVCEVHHLLRATIPSTVDIRLTLSQTPLTSSADPTSVHQVLVNLATNSVQAMPNGGVLEISVERSYVRDSAARAHPELHEGWYALVTVRDNGTGIDPAIRDRVFEPFFTTKPAGTGSGLGLSVVQGIMRDHEGAVTLESEVGVGTAVQCWFPEILEAVAPADARKADPAVGRGERILLVDDEPSLTRIFQRHLSGLNYDVVVENDARAALDRFRADPGGFDLVITDLTMPGMDGVRLAHSVKGIRPDVRILLMSGYAQEFPLEHLRSGGIRAVLKKPVLVEELARAVRAVLDEQPT